MRDCVRLLILCMLPLAGCGGGGSTPEFTVTAIAADHGSISPASRTVKRGETATFTVIPDENYKTHAVNGCGGLLSGNTFTTGPITGDCTVNATFQVIRHRVFAQFSVPGGGSSLAGTIEPPDILVAQGTTATFTIHPDPAYLITGASGCEGELTGLNYVTGPIFSQCTVTVDARLPAVSGRVFPAAGTYVDSDVNQFDSGTGSNNNLRNADAIPSPVILGGYVNRAGKGPSGPLFADGDEVDIYHVTLEAGHSVVMTIASEDEADDLDLFLLDMDAMFIDVSLDATSRIEQVTVPEDGGGEYFVVVYAFSGASNYLLEVGESIDGTVSTMRLNDPFVPGEAVVRMRARAGDAPPRNTLHEMDRLDVMEDMSGRAGLVATTSSAVRTHLAALVGMGIRDDDALLKLETLFAVKTLHHDPATEAALPNYLHRLDEFIPNDPFYPRQWHYPQIGLPAAWTQSTGDGVIVAVIDSGVLLAHTDLQGQFVQGYDFILDQPGGNDPGDDPDPGSRSSFHGTHVAGIVAAATDNGVQGAGVAFGAKIMPLRACDRNGCSSFAVEQALRYAAGLPNDTGTVPAAPAHVINLSLGRDGPPSGAEQALYDLILETGLVVVASAGNENKRQERFPAAYDGVIAVSAVGLDKLKAPYSNMGEWIDIAAPGGNMTRDDDGDGHPDGVLSTFADDSGDEIQFIYEYLQGTSMAAPHVSGVIALMRALDPGLTPYDILFLLKNGLLTDDLGSSGKDQTYGYGLINAAKAVQAATDFDDIMSGMEPRLEASPSQVFLGAFRDRIEIRLSNAGGGDLVLGEPTSQAPWLGVEMQPADRHVVATLTVDRTGLEPDFYSSSVRFPSDANVVFVRVNIRVVEAGFGHIPRQEVRLLDPETLEVRYQSGSVSVSNGVYSFHIFPVEGGSYLLVSGSDHDNDGNICGMGESCGIYPHNHEPILLEVGGADFEDLEFTSGYGVTLDQINLDAR